MIHVIQDFCYATQGTCNIQISHSYLTFFYIKCYVICHVCFHSQYSFPFRFLNKSYCSKVLCILNFVTMTSSDQLPLSTNTLNSLHMYGVPPI